MNSTRLESRAALLEYRLKHETDHTIKEFIKHQLNQIYLQLTVTRRNN